jgi:hypothetical protein
LIDEAMDNNDREGEGRLRNRLLQYTDYVDLALRTVDVLNKNCAMETRRQECGFE